MKKTCTQEAKLKKEHDKGIQAGKKANPGNAFSPKRSGVG